MVDVSSMRSKSKQGRGIPKPGLLVRSTVFRCMVWGMQILYGFLGGWGVISKADDHNTMISAMRMLYLSCLAKHIQNRIFFHKRVRQSLDDIRGMDFAQCEHMFFNVVECRSVGG